MSVDAVRRLLEAAAAVPTPSLIVDVAAADRNITAAVQRTEPVRLRPHFKAHKSSSLMRRQVPQGSGVTCATADEAIVLARAGFTDILIANEVVDEAALRTLTSVAEASAITVAVDDPRHVSALAAAAERSAVSIGVLIEIDVGHHRCGIEPRTPRLLELARDIDEAAGLILKGLMGYEGHAALEPDAVVRRRRFAEACSILAEERRRLLAAGFACEVVSGGSTGTLAMARDLGVLTEVQAGSYVLMDTQYGDLDVAFEQALYCVTTVTSTRPGQVVVDAGLKSLNGDGPQPIVCGIGLSVDRLNDEHAIIQAVASSTPAIGDRLLLIPSHVDPCVNLHDMLFAVEPGGTVVEWPVDGRRLRDRPPEGAPATRRVVGAQAGSR